MHIIFLNEEPRVHLSKRNGRQSYHRLENGQINVHLNKAMTEKEVFYFGAR